MHKATWAADAGHISLNTYIYVFANVIKYYGFHT